MYALFCKVGKEVQLLDFDDYPLNIQQPLWPKNALNGLKWWKPTKKVTESGKIVLNQPKLGQEMTELAKKWRKSTETLLNQLKFSMYRLKLSLYPKKKTLLTQQKNKGNRLKDDWTDQNLMCIHQKYWTGQDLVDMSLDSHTNTFILTRGILIQNSE